MAVDTVRHVGIILGLKMARIVQFFRRMTLLAIAGDLRFELAEALCGVRLVRVLIALLRPVTVGAEDRRCRMHAMHRIVQLNRIDTGVQRLSRRQRDGLGAVNMTELAG